MYMFIVHCYFYIPLRYSNITWLVVGICCSVHIQVLINQSWNHQSTMSGIRLHQVGKIFGRQLLEDEYIDKLDEIEKNHPDDIKRCCAEMFKYWLEVDSEANWNKLTDALNRLDRNR